MISSFGCYEGIVVVAAAGNFESDACAYSPASSRHVLTVRVFLEKGKHSSEGKPQ